MCWCHSSGSHRPRPGYSLTRALPESARGFLQTGKRFRADSQGSGLCLHLGARAGKPTCHDQLQVSCAPVIEAISRTLRFSAWTNYTRVELLITFTADTLRSACELKGWTVRAPMVAKDPGSLTAPTRRRATASGTCVVHSPIWKRTLICIKIIKISLKTEEGGIPVVLWSPSILGALGFPGKTLPSVFRPVSY